MKTVITTLGTAGLLTVAAHADMTLAAPGMETKQGYSGNDLDEQVSVGQYWRYEVTGYEWRLVAGEPITNDSNNPGGVDPETGKLVYKNDKSQFHGTNTVTAYVFGTKSGTKNVLSGALEAMNIMDLEKGAGTFASPLVFSDEEVTVGFSQDANMSNDYGSYIALRGVCVKEPPLPEGSMTAPDLVDLGSTPTIDYTIKRVGITGTSPTFEPQPWAPGVTPGDTPPESTTSGGGGGGGSSESSVEAPNYDKNKTNNGHGNNADGVDVSNPGKSAEKWAAKGIYDTDGAGNYLTDAEAALSAPDDESTGGGAAPSGQ